MAGCERSALHKTGPPSHESVITDEYELHSPINKSSAVLCLFGGYPERAADIKREFDIVELAIKNDIAVVLMNYNQKLWLEEGEKSQLAKFFVNIMVEHDMPQDNVYIGGFSSGGVISLLICDYLIGAESYGLEPKGVFIVDSPIDLAALYRSSVKNVERNFSPTSVQESTWLLETLGEQFGDPAEHIERYDEASIYTDETDHTYNLRHLMNTKIRLYTEPDTLWWREHRMVDPDQTNAYYIEKLYESLIAKGYNQVDYIPTKNKGYRANGERHPHSWSIVDQNELIEWMIGVDIE